MSNNLFIIESPKRVDLVHQRLSNSFPDHSWMVLASINPFTKADNGELRIGHTDKPVPTDLRRSKNPNGLFDVTPEHWPDAYEKAISNIASAITAHDFDHIFIATDPDSEGDLVAKHIYDSLSDNQSVNPVRIDLYSLSDQTIEKVLSPLLHGDKKTPLPA